MKKIESVKVKKIVDHMPDTSILGKYTDELEPGVIVRKFDKFFEKLTKAEKEEIPEKGREFRAFKPYAGGEKPGSKYYRKYGMQDYKRMKGLENNDWCYLGIMVEAEICTSDNGKEWLINHVSSGGLWGIESDSGEEYFKEVAEGEKSGLSKTLHELGFTDKEINAAFKNATEEED